MNMLTYALQRMFRAVWPEPERPTFADNVAAASADEEHRQRVLRMVGRQLFGCDVAVYKHQMKGGHPEYVIVVLEGTFENPGKGAER